MADAVFVDGVPAKITIHDFRRHHLHSFPPLTDSEYDGLITDAIDIVYTMFPAVAKLWDWHPQQLWFDKTTLCYRFLTAWLIADQHPDLMSRGGDVIGSLKEKKVDGVHLKFNIALLEGNSPIVLLRSNDFGRKALMMIQTSAKRALLRNCPVV